MLSGALTSLEATGTMTQGNQEPSFRANKGEWGEGAQRDTGKGCQKESPQIMPPLPIHTHTHGQTHCADKTPLLNQSFAEITGKVTL